MQIDRAEYLEAFFPKPSPEELAVLIAEHPPLKHPCAGCVYVDGTEGANTPATVDIATMCNETGHPFFCYKAKDDLGLCKHLCAGWMEKNHAD